MDLYEKIQIKDSKGEIKMIEIKGKNNTAKVFTNNAESTALDQIRLLCDQEFTKDSKIRIMPDTHAGAGCTIGTTMTITDKIVPNLVGVDIGCGVSVAKFKKIPIDLDNLDKIIRKNVPCGFEVRKTFHRFVDKNLQDGLSFMKNMINVERALLSIGTLGGGNHFIELNEDEYFYYLVVHSGSRNMGKQIAEFYQKIADEKHPECTKDLAYLDDRLFCDYLVDMSCAQDYAQLNRMAIIDVILRGLNVEPIKTFTTVHNYIDIRNNILRKGAVSAEKGETLIIPINMRDGSIIAKGKGNPDWNYSAPHGAGRLMARGQAKMSLKLEDFEKSMEGIYTTCVSTKTIDESPMVYKDMNEIISNIGDTVEIVKIIKPIYNFKASEDNSHRQKR